MGRNDEPVKAKLGRENWDILMGAAMESKINSQHMKDISQALHPSIGGSHLRRVNELRRLCDDSEFREILSDWWNEELYSLDHLDALRKLSDIMNSREVNLPSISSKLEPRTIISIQEKEKKDLIARWSFGKGRLEPQGRTGRVIIMDNKLIRCLL